MTETNGASQLQNEYLTFLLSQARIQVVAVDIHERTEMSTFNRSRPEYVMSYHKVGHANLRVNNKVYAITPGTVVLIPPNIAHDHYKTSSERTVFMWWHFTYKISDSLDVLKFFNFPLTFQPLLANRFESVFNEFVGATKDSDQFPKVLLREAKALELLYLLLESAIRQSAITLQFRNDSERFFLILSEMVKFPERKFSLTELSDRLHLHPTYVSNRFRMLFGKSLGQVQRDLRIDRAKTLLSTTSFSVAEVAENVGLQGNSELTRMFTRYVGLTPSQYRNISTRER